MSIIIADDVSSAMRKAGTLVYFHESVWQARVREPLAAAKAAQSAGAVEGSVSMTKFLLPGVDKEYRAVCNEISRARRTHNKLTVPWGRRPGCGYLFFGADGQSVFNYLEEIGQHELKIQTARNAFRAVYGDAVKEAATNLGSLWNVDDYIAISEIDDRFGIAMEFDPIPVDADWMNVPRSEGLSEILAKHTNKRGENNVKQAIARGVTQLQQYVMHMVEKLGDKDAKRHYKSMVENVREAMDLIAPFNLLDDPEFDRIIDETRKLVKHPTEVIVSNEGLRTKTYQEAILLVDQISDYAEKLGVS